MRRLTLTCLAVSALTLIAASHPAAARIQCRIDGVLPKRRLQSIDSPARPAAWALYENFIHEVVNRFAARCKSCV